MIRKMQVGLILMLISFQLYGQFPEKIAKKDFVLMFYNVENLFDTLDNPITRDEEFTPVGKNKWNTEKYFKKLDNISKVIASVPGKYPDFIGFCEVENKIVLEDLVHHKNIKKARYSIIHHESPDGRGIDLAVLYKKNEFRPLFVKNYPNVYPGSEDYPSRDIMYVKGLTKRKDTLHLFINHWSSRSGGQSESEPKRIYAAKIVRQLVDSILIVNAHAKLVVMGDFNDEPSNASLNEALRARKEIEKEGDLLNLMFAKNEEGKGSYLYRNNWNMLDNIIVSKALLNGSEGINLIENTAYIFNPEFICYKNNQGQLGPNRTLAGSRYFGGYSDHFPVFTVFKLK